VTRGAQIPLPMRREDLATWENWLSRSATLTLERWLGADLDEKRSAYLWGNAGIGKSHVLQACCDNWGYDARYLPLRDLLEYPPEQVLAGVEQAGLIAIDDVDAIESASNWHEPLFNLFNQSQERGGCLAVAAACAPPQLSRLLPDLRSRLGSLPVFHLPGFSGMMLRRCWALKRRLADCNCQARSGDTVPSGSPETLVPCWILSSSWII